MSRVISAERIVRIRDGVARPARDKVAVEEPLEMRVAGRPVGVTMRTPGQDVELALGYCITEGLIGAADDAAQVRYCVGKDGTQNYNVLTVDLRPGVPEPDPSLDRLSVTSSSCGVCGKASIDAVTVRCAGVAADSVVVSSSVISALPDRVRQAQRVFDATGGLHAAGLATPDGEVIAVREDVGRHNAVDKVVGWAAMNGRLPLSGLVLVVSGRCSFEIAQKAAVAGAPIVVAVSAPTSLACDLADDLGVTLVGFVRGTGMNVYTHPQRIAADAVRDLA
jgi:FdhD protein